ncbi:protein of unknown function (DUF4112) domain containing protein [Rhypophila decipiens]
MNAVVSILGKKALGNYKTKHNPNSDNIRYERVPVYNKKGEVVKHKEHERSVPVELSQNDQKILKKVRRKAYRWDQGFRICCTRFRFGWSAIIGLIPMQVIFNARETMLSSLLTIFSFSFISVGDIIEILMAMSLVNAAAKIDGGLPAMLRARMMTNVLLDFGIGFIPLLGDIGDAFFRANTRNAWLLDTYLSEKAKALRDGHVSDPEGGSPHRVSANALNQDIAPGLQQNPSSQQAPTKPAPARTGGYLLAGRERQPDLETGLVDTGPSGNGGGSNSQGKKKSRK